LFPDHDPLIGGHRDVAGEGNAQPLIAPGISAAGHEHDRPAPAKAQHPKRKLRIEKCTATEPSDSTQKKARPSEGRPAALPNSASTFMSGRTLTAAIAAAGRLQVLTGTTSIPNPPVREGRGELSYQRPRRALLPESNSKTTYRNIARKDELRVERQTRLQTTQQEQTQPGQQAMFLTPGVRHQAISYGKQGSESENLGTGLSSGAP